MEILGLQPMTFNMKIYWLADNGKKNGNKLGDRVIQIILYGKKVKIFYNLINPID